MSDFHRAFLKMAWLHLCRITNDSTVVIKLLLKFKQRVALAVEHGIHSPFSFKLQSQVADNVKVRFKLSMRHHQSDQ